MLIPSTEHKKDFYQRIVESENVVIIPSTDVDSLCATTNLTSLLDADEIMYSVNAVASCTELQAVFNEYAALAKSAAGSASTSTARTPTHFVLINCGGYRSCLELNLPECFSIFVIDSRRPFHLDNVYNQEQIYLLCQSSEIKSFNLPKYNEIFNPEFENDDDYLDDDDEEGDENERLTLAARVERRILKRKAAENWRNNRERLLYEYSQFTYTSTPSSVLLLQLAHQMAKSSASLTWCAAVGLANAHIEHEISSQTYANVCLESMKPFIRRFAPRDRNKIESTFRVSFDRELALPLYRHWTLNESIFNDIHFIRTYRLWTQAGKDKLLHVYANLGIPRDEAGNSYDKLSSERRAQVFEILNQNMNMNYYSFFSHFGYARNFSSADIARALSLLIQQSAHVASPAPALTASGADARFWVAFRLLKYYLHANGGQSHEMDAALAAYKTALITLTTLVFDSIRQKRLVLAKTFLMLTIQNGKAAEVEFLNSLHCIHLFMHLALRVFATSAATERKLRKPLFVAILNREIDGHKWYTCSGCMSLRDVNGDPERKSFIPALFTRITEDTSLNLIYESVDPSVILVREDSYAPFFLRVEHELPTV